MSPKELGAHLQAAGALLGKPASAEEISVFESQFGFSMTARFRAIYGSFNGFKFQNSSSVIDLWSLKEIAETSRTFICSDNRRYIAIGDFLMDSDLIMANLEFEGTPVFLLFEQIKVAENVDQFLERLVSGALDLPSSF
ncbi:SMI1/KNR4 family protein [Dongia sp.]|uniref:SMI1/KNR4 family protein n=1 Tax=Dongia sp. TaxID=1977262 RepID=UPI003750FCA7